MRYKLNSEVLDEARAYYGLTSDEQLAQHIGITTTALRNLRKGRAEPRIGTLVKIQRVTNRPLESLISPAS